MDSAIIVKIAVIGALALIGLGVVGILVAAVKSLVQGKQDTKRIAVMAVPFIVFGISYAVLGDVTKAGVLTTLIMMAIMIFSIVITGVRGAFKI